MFLRPSYTTRGVKTSGAATVWSRLMISMLRRAGSVLLAASMTVLITDLVRWPEHETARTHQLHVKTRTVTAISPVLGRSK